MIVTQHSNDPKVKKAAFKKNHKIHKYLQHDFSHTKNSSQNNNQTEKVFLVIKIIWTFFILLQRFLHQMDAIQRRRSHFSSEQQMYDQNDFEAVS